MKPGPRFVAQLIMERFELDAPPRDILEITAALIIEYGWATLKSEALERAESWRKQTLGFLVREVSSLRELGRPSRITFNSSSEHMIQGACFVEPRDGDDIRDSKVRRLRSGAYYQAIRNLNSGDFEHLCGKLIGLLGVQAPKVTKRTSDQGIDFYGKLSLESILSPQDLSPTIQRQLVIWLVGQAKRYTEGQSGTPEIRDLVGAIALGRAGVFASSTDPYPDLAIRVADPVFAIFITTGSLSSAAWRLLQRSGVIGMDGEMVAAFLADRGAGLSASTFNENEFLMWLKSPS
jgi:Restriction endonuclease